MGQKRRNNEWSNVPYQRVNRGSDPVQWALEIFICSWRDDTVLHNNRAQMLAVLAVGAAGGWLAASGRLTFTPRSEAAPPAQATADMTDGSCCEGADRGMLLAMANPATATLPLMAGHHADSGKKPNILFIMGDDVGWFNIGAYHRGIMSGKTPNLDKLAKEGMLFTDYYAEASCTAGRANFITGEIPLRTGLTTVGQAGADVGMPDKACTIATALKAQGYPTGQFGKNHLGDLNKYLPTLHGFDEFFGYLYHLDAMSDPFWYSFPSDPEFYKTTARAVWCTAGRPTRTTPTEMPRWGKVGKQKIVDEGPLRPFKDMTADHQGWQKGPPGSKYDMETFDEVLVEAIERLHGQGQEGRQAVLPLAQHHPHARLHVPGPEIPGRR